MSESTKLANQKTRQTQQAKQTQETKQSKQSKPSDESTKLARLKTKLCDNPGCLATRADKSCARCHTVRYCCPECQRAHWILHRVNCKQQNILALAMKERDSITDSATKTEPNMLDSVRLLKENLKEERWVHQHLARIREEFRKHRPQGIGLLGCVETALYAKNVVKTAADREGMSNNVAIQEHVRRVVSDIYGPLIFSYTLLHELEKQETDARVVVEVRAHCSETDFMLKIMRADGFGVGIRRLYLSGPVLQERKSQLKESQAANSTAPSSGRSTPPTQAATRAKGKSKRNKKKKSKSESAAVGNVV